MVLDEVEETDEENPCAVEEELRRLVVEDAAEEARDMEEPAERWGIVELVFIPEA